MSDKNTILVVDDTLENLKLLTDILTEAGYQVRPANSGELALTSVAAKPPDLILLDILMPGMNGFEVCRRLKERKESHAIPIMFISASTESETRIEGLRLGAVDFIDKPFQREEMITRVRTHLELGQLRARLERRAVELQAVNEQLEREIAVRKRMEAEIREMSFRDHLTGLYNRRGFIVLAEQQLKATNRSKRRMLLAFIDVNDMKQINDTLGHEAGDNALIDTANILRKTFRESDIIGRIGGDEFTVLAIDITDLDHDILLKRLEENMDDWNAKQSRPYHLMLCCGTAIYDPQFPISLNKLMSLSDGLMYEQKKTLTRRPPRNIRA